MHFEGSQVDTREEVEGTSVAIEGGLKSGRAVI